MRSKAIDDRKECLSPLLIVLVSRIKVIAVHLKKSFHVFVSLRGAPAKSQ
ncbi:unnamed protein product [Ciceribacter selenitireducens ATCC BAA-1503]|uniref:Uncharacterized protein n=1 Tax=Ciceribacter selenitireducens ATCC BAA-1503 TaxID=1336235 RepID=A0A376AI22_9HYPH|nr:unnamed protein product [Ciceribacter selenitireducens ATCC BAA-1503]